MIVFFILVNVTKIHSTEQARSLGIVLATHHLVIPYIQIQIHKELFMLPSEYPFFFFFFGCAACEILVPPPRIKLVPPTMEVQSPNHWTAREIP